MGISEKVNHSIIEKVNQFTMRFLQGHFDQQLLQVSKFFVDEFSLNFEEHDQHVTEKVKKIVHWYTKSDIYTHEKLISAMLIFNTANYRFSKSAPDFPSSHSI